MPSHSIWKEQVDEALLIAIRNTISVTNFNTQSKTALGVNGVIVRNPEDDFKITTYPCISVYNLYDRFNAYRYTFNPDTKIFSRSFEQKKVSLSKSSKKYDLTYQIDFWSKKQVHMNEMTLQWLHKFTPLYNLNVNDLSGEPCNIMMMQRRSEGLKKQDLLDGSERIFHSFVTYDIWVEIDEEEIINVPMVTNIETRGNEVNSIVHKTEE